MTAIYFILTAVILCQSRVSVMQRFVRRVFFRFASDSSGSSHSLKTGCFFWLISDSERAVCMCMDVTKLFFVSLS